jgi:hypothetical protein
MKQFIKKISIFLIPGLLLVYPADLFLSHLLKYTSLGQGEFEVWNDIYHSKTNVSLAIYGSSRAWVHIDSSILEDSLDRTTYNFGIDGQNIWLQLFRHNQILKYNVKPKTILYSVDIFTLGPKSGNYNKDQHLPYLLWNDDYSKSELFPKIFYWYEYSLPMLRFQNKGNLLLYSIHPHFKNTPLRNKGYARMDWEWNTDFETVRAKQKGFKAKIDSSSITLMKSFLAECKQDGIQVIFVYTPEYIEGQKFTTNRSEVLSIYHEMAAHYNIPFLDYSNHELSFNKANFYNTTHMNGTAATRFSSILAEDIKPLIAN